MEKLRYYGNYAIINFTRNKSEKIASKIDEWLNTFIFYRLRKRAHCILVRILQ